MNSHAYIPFTQTVVQYSSPYRGSNRDNALSLPTPFTHTTSPNFSLFPTEKNKFRQMWNTIPARKANNPTQVLTKTLFIWLDEYIQSLISVYRF